MLTEVLTWGLKPAWITGDSWYSSLENLKFVRNYKLSFLFAGEKNRLISIEKGAYVQAQTLDSLPESGLIVYLKGFGQVKLFRTVFKNESRHYILYVPETETDKLSKLTYENFKSIHDNHWQSYSIEQLSKFVILKDFRLETVKPLKIIFSVRYVLLLG